MCWQSWVEWQRQRSWLPHLSFGRSRSLAHAYCTHKILGGSTVSILERLCQHFQRHLFFDGQPETLFNCRKYIYRKTQALRRKNKFRLLVERLWEAGFAFTNDIAEAYSDLQTSDRLEEQLREESSITHDALMDQAIETALTKVLPPAFSNIVAEDWLVAIVEHPNVDDLKRFFSALEDFVSTSSG